MIDFRSVIKSSKSTVQKTLSTNVFIIMMILIYPKPDHIDIILNFFRNVLSGQL